MEDRARFLLFVALFACSPQAVPIELCPEGTIATADGCADIPTWNPWSKDAGPTSPPPDAAATPDSGFEPDAQIADAGEDWLDLRGAWAVRVMNTQLVSSQVFDPQQVTFIGLSIVTIDRALGVSTRPCSLTSSPYGGTTTTWSEQAIAATVIRFESASADAIEIGKRMVLERTQVMGWNMQDPAEELPTGAWDDRVYDADGDNNPGVTLQISGTISGDMYVASRAVVLLDGTITTADRIEGGSTTQQEQSVLGASNDILELGGSTSQPIPELSTFAMIRVDPALECALLIETADQLFMDP